MAAQTPQVVDEGGTGAGVLARLWWMLGGNVVLALSIIFIIRSGGAFFHKADPVFAITVLSLVLVRYLDIRFCRGLTATGFPATMRTWTRYTIFLAVGSPLVWVLAHGAGHLLFRAA
jgi:hypothetical protein